MNKEEKVLKRLKKWLEIEYSLYSEMDKILDSGISKELLKIIYKIDELENSNE